MKPYATTASYSRSHDVIKYDVFDTATVAAEVWSATSGFRDGPVPVTLTFTQAHEDSSDFNEKLTTDQRTLDLSAHNHRDKEDLTELRYQLNQFDRDTQLSGTSLKSGNTYHHVSVIDTEHFHNSVLRVIVPDQWRTAVRLLRDGLVTFVG